MDVVRHQYTGMDRAFIVLGGICNPIGVGTIVAVFEEDRFPAVTTLHDLHRNIGEKNLGFPSTCLLRPLWQTPVER